MAMEQIWSKIVAEANQQNPRHARLLTLAREHPTASAGWLGARVKPPLNAEAARWVFWKYGLKRGRSIDRSLEGEAAKERDSERSRVFGERKKQPNATLKELHDATGISVYRITKFFAESGAPLSDETRSIYTEKTRAKMLVWREEKRLTYEQIAKKLGGVSTSTVGIQLARARAERAVAPRAAGKSPSKAKKAAL